MICLCFSLVTYLTELIIIKGQNCFTFCARLGFLLDVQRTHLLVGFWPARTRDPVIHRDKESTGIWSRWIPFPKHVARPENPAAWLFLFTGFHICSSASWECAAGLSTSFWEAYRWNESWFAPSQICRLESALPRGLLCLLSVIPVSVSQVSPSALCWTRDLLAIGFPTASVLLATAHKCRCYPKHSRNNCKSVVPT